MLRAPVTVVKVGVGGIVWNTRVAPADGIDVQNHKAPSGQLDTVGIAGFSIVLIAMDVYDAWECLLVLGIFGLKQFCPDRYAVEIPVGHIRDLDTSKILLHGRRQRHGTDQY